MDKKARFTVIHRYVFGVSLLLSGISSLSAQELNLFEAVESDEQQTTGPFQLQESSTSQGGQPAFTLRSTSRVGDSYHTVLINRDGSIAEADWLPGQQSSIPGYEAFVITGIAGRQVSVRYPGNENCFNSEALGVSCEGNIAKLTLANSAPVVNTQAMDAVFGPSVGDPFAAAVQAAGNRPDQGAIRLQDGQQVVINPFSGEPEVVPQLSPQEQAARAERQAARSARLRQFEPERINEADVPEGMRLVRTPFGDRIVPVRQ